MPEATSPEILPAFGRAIRKMRVERGFSQERLAEEPGVHPRYLSDVERGVRNVSLVNIERLARALSVGLPTLMAEVEPARRP